MSDVPDVCQEVEVVEEIVPYQPFQQLFITCPDGLTVSYFLETAYGEHVKKKCLPVLMLNIIYALKDNHVTMVIVQS